MDPRRESFAKVVFAETEERGLQGWGRGKGISRDPSHHDGTHRLLLGSGTQLLEFLLFESNLLFIIREITGNESTVCLAGNGNQLDLLEISEFGCELF